ncbi:octopamine receptor beta-2R-like [Oculina patagonica]
MSSWYWLIGWLPSLLAVVGNGLVIYLVTARRKLRTTGNRFVLSLAIADFCVGACFYPGHAICHFLLTSCNMLIRDDIAVLMIYSSVSNLCAMALDRYIAIVKPLRYASLMTARRATVLTAFAWIIPLSIYFIPSVSASLGLLRIDFGISVIVWTSIFEFVPCTGLLLATIHALTTSRKHCRRDAKLRTQLRYNRPNLKRLGPTSSAKVLATVVALFLICYAVEVYSSFCHFTALCVMKRNLYKVVRFLVIVNSAANPIAYAFLRRDIRKELHETFCKNCLLKTKRKRSYDQRTSV